LTVGLLLLDEFLQTV